ARRPSAWRPIFCRPSGRWGRRVERVHHREHRAHRGGLRALSALCGEKGEKLISKDIEIKNKLGLQARAGAELVHCAARFKSDIKVKKGDEEVDGKSILGILLLAAGRGSVITITANGEDEQEAIEAIEKLIDAKFDEVE